VKVRSTAQGHNLEMDLRGFPGAPGKYSLSGEWDWEVAKADGNLELARLGDLKQARVTSDLTEGTGVTALVVEGAGFQFLDRVTIRPAGGQPELAQPVQFILPDGRRGGAQSRVNLDVDTRSLRAGKYVLALQQADGKAQELPLTVNSSAGKIENLPLRI